MNGTNCETVEATGLLISHKEGTMEILLRAGKGKILTDGENYGKTISLAEGVPVDKYYEITEEEYEKITETKNAEIGD